MFYKVSNEISSEDRLYGIKNILYITRYVNEVEIFYENFSNELKLDSEEEAKKFMNEIHRVLNKKSLFKRLLDFFI